jgi:hypothetical protein
LGQLAFLTDCGAEAIGLQRDALGVADRLVKRFGNTAVGTRPVDRKADFEITN